MKCIAIFVVGDLLFGVASLAVGHCIWGENSLLQGGAAFGLAFVPASATLAWVLVSYRSSPDMQLMASLAGSPIRMILSLGGGFLLMHSEPENFGAFWLWLAWFYLIFLAFEITLLYCQQPKPGQTPKSK